MFSHHTFKALSKNYEKRPLACSYLSVLLPPSWNNSTPTRRIFMKLDIWVCFENLSRKFTPDSNLTTKAGTLYEDRSTFMIISRWSLLRMRNISDKLCRENRSTHFMSNFYPKMTRLWDDVNICGRTRQAKDENKFQRMRFAWWVNKATAAHSEYVILTTLPLQWLLHEGASMLRL